MKIVNKLIEKSGFGGRKNNCIIVNTLYEQYQTVSNGDLEKLINICFKFMKSAFYFGLFK
jgi:hypothetical protein